MSLTFLIPAFLVGMAALVVPVLVHLRHKERKEPVRFPSLMFLRRIPFREVRRQRITHWWLFLLRSLAVALLVFAFARPFFRAGGAASVLAARSGREVVILLDRSASMGYGTRWNRALAAARDVVNGLGADDRASVVAFDLAAAVIAGPTDDRSLLLAAIGGAEPGASATRFSPALRAVRDLLFASDRPQLELVVISDFQRAGWQGEDIPALPEGTVFTRVDLSDPAAWNLAVVDAVMIEEAGAARSARFETTVTATGAEGTRNGRLRLEFDGRTVASAPVSVESPGNATVVLGPVGLGTGDQRARLVLESGDSLAADDVFGLVAAPSRPVRVVLRRDAAAPGRFLAQALAISSTPRVEVSTRTAGLRAADLDAADVVVLEDVSFPVGDEGRRLVEWVRGGGGLIHVLGERSSGAWPAGLAQMRVGGVVDRSGPAGGTIGLIRREHPVFEPFRAPGSGDFAGTRIFRYRSVIADSLAVLARYDDGAPALIEAVAERGRALVLTTPADNLWSDIPLQPWFLPLAHQAVLHVAGWIERPVAWRAGQVAALPRERLGDAEAVVVVKPDGERERRVLGAGPLTVALDGAGFHEIREAGIAGRLLATVAANLPPEEASPAAFDPGDLVLAAGARDSAAARGETGTATLTAAERERRQGLWWYALAAVTLLLIAESVLAARTAGPVRLQPPVEAP